MTFVVPPNFGDSPKTVNFSTVVGSSESLHCSADGFPFPDIAWFKDGSFVISDETIQIDNNVLELSNIDLSHQGTYTCEASNVAGKEIKTFSLKVNGKFYWFVTYS